MIYWVMSLYILPKKHHLYLAQVATKWEAHYSNCGTLELAQQLLAANVSAAQYYDNDDEGAGYNITAADIVSFDDEPNPVQVLKTCACYAEKLWDWDEWPNSQAWLIIDNIRDAAIFRLPGYKEAIWGSPEL